MRFAILKNIPVLLIAGVAATACSTTPPPPPAKPAAAPAPQVVEKPVTPAAAVNMANNCFACHGPNGVSPGSIPSLHALTAQNISEMLKAFKGGQRPSTVMGRHAKGYTNTEIEAISNYIASLNKK
jgi:cytochrome subunit of sulfide dehydrogenase